MDIINNRYNKSTIFILPLLYEDIKYTDIITDNFINCYISDIQFPDPDNSLTIEFDNDVARFRIKEDKTDDYKKIIRSQYSNISNISKKQIISFWQQDENSHLYSVLYKTNKILEYWSKKSGKEIKANEENEYWPKFNTYEETRGLNTLYKMFNFNLINNNE